MNYITLEEYKDLGFAEVDDFSDLRQRAEMAVDLFTQLFLSMSRFRSGYPAKKKAVSLLLLIKFAT